MFCIALPAQAECLLEFRAGETVRSTRSGHHGFVEIFQPASAPDVHGYPVILWYHGNSANLEPNTAILRGITNGEAFVLVGMDYGSERFYRRLHRRELEREVVRADGLLDDLAACLPIDRDTVLIGGYSQGGYATTLIGERMLDRIAGMIVLGAGRADRADNLPAEESIAGMPMFFAAGADDRDFGAAADASARLYASLGAKVSLERWPETDHFEGWRWYQQGDANVAGIRDWLNAILDARD